MRKRTVALLVLFVVLTWAGAGGIAYGVVELTGGGSQGEQGEQGEQGPKGERGPAAPAAPFSSGSSCEKAIEAYLEGLSTPGLSDSQISTLFAVVQATCE